MSILSGLLGKSTEIDPIKASEEFKQLLSEGESVEKAYQLVRDSFIFTNRRLILIDVQGITGKKVEYHSYPYRTITHFSIETSGVWDLDAELKFWVSGNPVPVQRQFNKNVNVYQLQSVLAKYLAR